MQARAYKNEVIQFVMEGPSSLMLGMNFAFSLRDLGYDHWFIFGGFENTTCLQVMSVMPDAGDPRPASS